MPPLLQPAQAGARSEDTCDAPNIQVGSQLVEHILGELVQLRGYEECPLEVEKTLGEQVVEVGGASEEGQEGLGGREINRLRVLKDQDLPRQTIHV